MAHAYTTKRGKNKKAKLGVRKDQQQNQERGLKTINTDFLKFDGPRENTHGEIGRIGSASARLQDLKSRRAAALMDKCSNPTCQQVASTDTRLSECASCRQARYCGRDCQVAHWGEHKALCKEIKKKLQLKEAETAKSVAEALAQLDSVKLSGENHGELKEVEPITDGNEDDRGDDDFEGGDDESNSDGEGDGDDID